MRCYCVECNGDQSEPDDIEFAAMEFADLIQRYGYFPPSPRWALMPEKKWLHHHAVDLSRGAALSFHDAQCDYVLLEKDLREVLNRA